MIQSLVETVSVFYSITHKGLMKMNHTYKQAGNMSIAPPPETHLNDVIIEEGAQNSTLLIKESAI